MSVDNQSPFDKEILKALEYPTPFFLFSKEKIVTKLQELQRNFANAEICYAMKANFEEAVLCVLRDAGSGFEVSSVYELHKLQAIGVPPEKIIYGTSIKPAAHVKEFFEYGVDRFAFDSLPELEKIAIMAPRSRVYVRVSVNDSGSVFRFSEKFGTGIENIVPFLQRAKALGLQPYGISFHVGSQASNPAAWANALKTLREPLALLRKHSIQIDMIDIGGGYPCAYASVEDAITLVEISQLTYAEYRQLPYQPKLLLEPGRVVIAEAGIAVANVIQRVQRQGSTWLFLDAGVYNAFFETMAYQGSTRYKVASLDASTASGETVFALAGPTGDSPDIIMREVLLPQDINVGDRLVFYDVGAYSLVATSRFNGFPPPDVYFV